MHPLPPKIGHMRTAHVCQLRSRRNSARSPPLEGFGVSAHETRGVVGKTARECARGPMFRSIPGIPIDGRAFTGQHREALSKVAGISGASDGMVTIALSTGGIVPWCCGICQGGVWSMARTRRSRSDLLHNVTMKLRRETRDIYPLLLIDQFARLAFGRSIGSGSGVTCELSVSAVVWIIFNLLRAFRLHAMRGHG